MYVEERKVYQSRQEWNLRGKQEGGHGHGCAFYKRKVEPTWVTFSFVRIPAKTPGKGKRKGEKGRNFQGAVRDPCRDANALALPVGSGPEKSELLPKVWGNRVILSGWRLTSLRRALSFLLSRFLAITGQVSRRWGTIVREALRRREARLVGLAGACIALSRTGSA